MPTGDITSKELLSRMEVPTLPGVFVLGSFARHVTIYSQQVRALNLIHALCEEERLKRGSRIAVIGGGAAGLTAAAGAAVRGADVVLLEKLPGPVLLQRPNTKRWLHPHIYHWPKLQQQGDEAGLPLLNWRAGYPIDVFDNLGRQWKEILQKAGPQIVPRYGVSRIRIGPGTEKTLVSWTDSLAGGHRPFDIVILAVGFGLDNGQPHELKHYWSDDDLDDQGKWQNKKLLVSGSGDGGLTDLMRLCINRFRHDQVITAFADAPEFSSLQEKLLRIEEDSKDISPSLLTERYSQLVQSYSDPIKSVVASFGLRQETSVFLVNQGSAMLGSNSAILNRFIVSALHHLGAFEYIPQGIQGDPQKTGDAKFRVTFGNGRDEDFDLVIQRHGPTSVLKSDFKEIWDDCETMRKEWQKLSQLEDRTWMPIYENHDFDSDRWEPNYTGQAISKSRFVRPNDFDFGGYQWCLLVVPARQKPPFEETPLERFTRFVLTNAERLDRIEQTIARPISREVITVYVDEILSDHRRYDWVVRALCAADVALFDVTGYDPAVMLLLGIRSAVRRGVTLLVINEQITPEVWSALPFNIKELNLFSTYNKNINQESPDYPTNMLESMITTGLKNLKALPHYLDVPAYEWLRRLGPDEEDSQAIPIEEQILLLCPFSETYTTHVWPTLRDELETAFSKFKPKKIARIIDTPSPQLVSQRLYDAIRRSMACMVDWTGWRANVFYELGVRVAVNGRGAICVIAPQCPGHAEAEAKHNPATLQALKVMFGPIEYRENGGRDPFDQVRKRYEALNSHSSALLPNGRLATDHTFQVIYHSILLSHELANKDILADLEMFVELMVGKEPKREGTPRTLFSENEDLSSEVRANAIERLAAAWFYLDGRHHARKLSNASPTKKAFRRIGSKLLAMLDPDSKEDAGLISEIKKVLWG